MVIKLRPRTRFVFKSQQEHILVNVKHNRVTVDPVTYDNKYGRIQLALYIVRT